MSALKQIRGQLRIIVGELLPSLLTTELYQALRKENDTRIKAIEEKQRDLQLFIMRATTAQMPKKEET